MRRLLAVPVLLLVLTGCVAPTPGPTPTPTPTTSATPASTPSPTAPPAPAADPQQPAAPVYTDDTADWIITYTGIGPIEFTPTALRDRRHDPVA